jgi:Tol biopolymer transport system component
MVRIFTVLLASLVPGLLLAGGEEEWRQKESVHLRNIRQITADFVRAGEGYFSPDGKKIIFQAEEKSENPFYQEFVLDLDTGAYRRVSPGVGKTTCGYFRPDGKKIIFSSTHLDPEAKKHYAVERQQRQEEQQTKKRRRYVWDFDPYMSIFEANPDGTALRRLTDVSGYNAEASYSSNGKHIVFCSNRSGPKDLELYIMDADGKNVRQLTHAPGCYNGGPFFSPDGKQVIFRSDRHKKDHLQLYVINADGSGERALTQNDSWVYWAPYWNPDGKHIIYTAADHSDPKARPNYDLYWMRIDNSKPGPALRLTYFPGADVLPVFNPDSAKVLWTSTRTADHSSQLFLADFLRPKEQ